MRSLAIVALSAALVLLVARAANAAEVPPTLHSESGQLTTGDAVTEPSCSNAMEHAAQMGLPAAPGDAASDGRLKFVWRLSEHGVLFRTDEFDQAQLTTRTTSLVTGLGTYTVRLSLPAHYEHFFFTVEGGVRVEGCAPAPNQSPATCKIIGGGSPGCFQLGFRLPPIDSAPVGPNKTGGIKTLYLYAGTSAFLSPGGKSRTLFVIPGDYSDASEKPGGHKLDPLAPDLTVESAFIFDPKTDETTLLIGNGSGGSSTTATVGLTLFGRSTRLVSEHELMAALDRTGRAVLHINFDFDKAKLRPDATPALEQIVGLLKNNTQLHLEIEGHTDAIGTTQHNKQLSEARARTVKSFIINHGIGSDRVEVAGLGATKPVADNISEDGRFKNRRVELVRK